MQSSLAAHLDSQLQQLKYLVAGLSSSLPSPLSISLGSLPSDLRRCHCLLCGNLAKSFFRHKQHNSLVLPVSIGKTLQVLDTSKSTYMPRQIQFLIVLRESVISRPI